jgi:Xaa-Pro aminopeptidase
MSTATLMAGIPATNLTLFHRIRFLVGDPCAILDVPKGSAREAVLIIRDIEMDRAKKSARADRVTCPADWAPASGLSGDRETATAQAVAECLKRSGVSRVTSDRTLPLSFVDEVRKAGIALDYDPMMGVMERRAKDAQEVELLRTAQRATEQAIEMACRTIARAKARADGVLLHEGSPLTSERVRTMLDLFLLERGYMNPPSIVACGKDGGDCHDHGHGELRTGEPILVDVFPKHKESLYNGDCTRTVVHGTPTPELVRMHKVVCEAKAAAIAAVRSGATGEQVHEATMSVMRKHNFERGLPTPASPETYTSIQHGTGHAIGLDVHEPPLLDKGGPALIVGDALTVEPGLYSKKWGGVRVEDMVIVTPTGCTNLNTLHEGLHWD